MLSRDARGRVVRAGWRIFALLTALSVSLYFQQRSLTVAAERIMPELSLSQMQIGWLLWVSTFGYSCFQFLGGLLGQRFGGRLTLFLTGVIAVVGGITLPIAPGLVSGAGLFTILLVAQLLMGVAQAPFFPVSSGVMQTWLPANRWALAQGVISMTAQLGAALTPPIIVLLMQRSGWQRALLWPVPPELLLVALWGWYARDDPRLHPDATTDELRALPAVSVAPGAERSSIGQILRVVSSKNVLVLTLSYVSMNYAWYLLSNWSFLYLIQERHFTVLQAGWLASLPPLGAALGCGVGGGITDGLCRRIGILWGYRLVPLIALPTAGALLLITILSSNPFLAVGALTFSFATIELTEGSFWAATMRVAQTETAAATGALNTGGTLGGIMGIPVVAYLSSQHQWGIAFALGSASAVIAAILWLWVNVVGEKAASGSDRVMLEEPAL